MLHDKIIAAIRTGCAVLGAAIVTAVVSWLGGDGLAAPKGTGEWALVVSGVLFGLFVGLYNLVVNLLTEHVWSGFGWLLGVNKRPAYLDPSPYNQHVHTRRTVNRRRAAGKR